MNYKNLGLLGWSAVLIAALLALPVVSVATSIFSGGGDTWSHLAATTLPRYVLNTGLLLALVACGVVSIGVVSAWLRRTAFPGAMCSNGRCSCRSRCRRT